jgi:RimJ/RimL family protein N-acetyltransferase
MTEQFASSRAATPQRPLGLPTSGDLTGPAASWVFPTLIRTRRTVLRQHRSEDASDMLRFHADPEVTRYLPWPVRDEEAVQQTLDDKIEQTVLDWDGAWLSLAVEQLGTRRVIGEVLLCRRDTQHGVAEVGYAFARDVHRRGFGTETVSALLRAAWVHLPLRVVVAHIDVANTGSRRMIVNLGFEPAGLKEGSSSLLRYALTRPAAYALC